MIDVVGKKRGTSMRSGRAEITIPLLWRQLMAFVAQLVCDGVGEVRYRNPHRPPRDERVERPRIRTQVVGGSEKVFRLTEIPSLLRYKPRVTNLVYHYMKIALKYLKSYFFNVNRTKCKLCAFDVICHHEA